MEAFEKELNHAKAKDADEDEGGEEGPAEIDEAELGDDPFARNEAGADSLDAGNEPWLNSDRDYTYQEVGSLVWSCRLALNDAAAAPTILCSTTRIQPRPPQLRWQALYYRASTDPA